MDNKTGELDEQLNNEFTQAVLPVTIFVGIEVVFGFFGNLLVIYVFLRHYHVCTFKYFVLCLAFIDFTCCVTTMPGEMVTQLYWYVYPVREVCKIKSFFNVFTVTAEALCLFTIGLDRYRKVCNPFSWQIKPRVAKYLCGLYYIISLFVALPTPIFWGLRSASEVYRNTTISVTYCEKDGQFDKTDYPIGYISTVGAFIMILLVLMLFQYVVVGRRLLIDRRRRVGSGLPIVNTSRNISELATNEKPKNGSYNTDTGSDLESKTTKELSNTATENTDKPINIETFKPDVQCKLKSRGRQAHTRNVNARVRSKTLIMFILTVTFIITTITYFVLVAIIASSEDILQYLTDSQKAVYFFFLRLYFINHVINPIVYGLLDPQFKTVIGRFKGFILNKFELNGQGYHA